MTVDVVAGRFALCDPIGAGGSGTVWRAFDTKRQRYCAAKLLRQRDAGDLLRFVREQSVRLDHPHIVSPYSWVAEDGTVLIASDLMAGGSVHTLIGDFGPFAEGTVTTVLRQVLSGLQAVHDAELIHRDVKPANLLLGATGNGPLHVVLTDFGLTISRQDARLTQVGMVIGTPGYVPPEVLRGGVPPDPRHDLFAAGRLALTMLAGQEPTGRVGELIATIHDPTLRSTVDALLSHHPEERPANAEAAIVLLTGAQADPFPRTADGEPIEVLEQLPELPAGWGPTGPLDPVTAGSARETPRATIVDVALTAPTQLPDHSTTAVARPADGPPSGGTGRPPVPTADGYRGPPASGPASPAPVRFTRRRGPLLAVVIAATAVAALVLGLWLLPGTTTNTPSDPPASTVASQGGTSPSRTSPNSASSDQPTTQQQPTTPVSTAVASVEIVGAGEGCTWQHEGDRRPADDGAVLVCSLADGAYRWLPPG